MRQACGARRRGIGRLGGDPVQMGWYHTHLMNETTDQVIRGLAGMIYVKDDNDPIAFKVPNDYWENDFSLCIQEKNFVLDSVTNPPTAKALVAGEKPGNGPGATSVSRLL